jgi:hypothetical protein
MISDAIKSAFKKCKERGWDKMYWMIDVHDTILKGEYSSNQSYNPPPDAIEVLKWLSDRDDMVIIIWTSSYAKDYDRLKDWFWNTHGIYFDYHNENPECGNTEYAEFTTKPYFNILVEDRAGFCYIRDWKVIKDTLIELGEWSTYETTTSQTRIRKVNHNNIC